MIRLWPTLQQFKRWSLPNKIGTIGAYCSIIALALYFVDKGVNLLSDSVIDSASINAHVSRQDQNPSNTFNPMQPEGSNLHEGLKERPVTLDSAALHYARDAVNRLLDKDIDGAIRSLEKAESRASNQGGLPHLLRFLVGKRLTLLETPANRRDDVWHDLYDGVLYRYGDSLGSEYRRRLLVAKGG